MRKFISNICVGLSQSTYFIIIIIIIIIFIIIIIIEISVIDPAEYKLPSIREICICMLVYKYENEVL